METVVRTFSIREARSLVKDLSKPNPTIYWVDFLVSVLLGHTCFAALVFLDEFSLQWLQSPAGFAGLWSARIVLFSLAAVVYLRAVLFIHELVHLPNQGFAAFRVCWNLLCGIPFLVPSFLYYPHVEHHRRKHYGTDKDGEYIDLSHRHPANLLLFAVVSIVVPLATFVRFALLTPLCWLIPGVKTWVERRASSMIIDVFYLRGDFGQSARRTMRWQELACFVWCVGGVVAWWNIAALNSAPYIGYALATSLVFVNNVRTLGAHRWVSDGHELSFEEQLLDSINYPHRPWITELWGPIGIRYHAIHHLFPSMPYHNLGIAHRRLMAGLPADSLYRETVRVSLASTILELWLRARARNEHTTDPSVSPDSRSSSPSKAA